MQLTLKTIGLTTLGFILCIQTITAQNTTEKFENDFNRAEKIFSEIYQDGKDESMSLSKLGYATARPIFLDLFKQDPSNMNLAFKLGICFLSSRKDRAQAIPHLSKAVTERLIIITEVLTKKKAHHLLHLNTWAMLII